MINARLDKAQPEIMIAGRNIKNLRHTDDTTLMTESEEELMSHLMKVKEESEKAGLKLTIQKTNIMDSMLVSFLKEPPYFFFFHSGCSSPKSAQGFFFLDVPTNPFVSSLFDNSHSDMCEVVIHCGFFACIF